MNFSLKLVALASACVFALTACGAGSSRPHEDGASAAPRQRVSADSETTPRPVIRTVHSDAMPRNLVEDPGSIATDPDVDLVVEGTVATVEYSLHEGLVPLTRMTISVARRSAGAGKTVVVWETGGFVAIDQLPRQDRSTVAGDPPKAGFVDYLPSGGAPHPQVGDRVLLALWENPNAGAAAGTYFEVGDSAGRFLREPDGDYSRAAHDVPLERVVSKALLDRYLKPA